MAKIMILTGSPDTLVENYGVLTKAHNVHVRYIVDDATLERYGLQISSGGFDRNKLRNSWDNERDRADVHFIEGLDHEWLDYALGIITRRDPNRKKVVINSSDPKIRADVQEKGVLWGEKWGG